MMKEEMVVLVNELDEQIGLMEKMKAHQEALLHRAFSVFLFDQDGLMLLQKRALTKYHSAGLWTNACCSHPRAEETVLAAAQRRLYEELGIKPEIHKAFSFTYKAEFDNGLTEHEFDHVFVGRYHGPITPNPLEVSEYMYRSIDDIRLDLKTIPDQYTEWFKIAFEQVQLHMGSLDL
ncbi:MAG: isopentenyl-diphosphate Delta-isomerase [Chitinophagaceae bacterium]